MSAPSNWRDHALHLLGGKPKSGESLGLAHAGAPRAARRAPLLTRFIERYLRFNQAVLERFAPPFGWDTDPGATRPWARSLQDHYAEIIGELDDAVEHGVRLPRMGEAFYIDPRELGLAAGVSLHPPTWRTYVLRTFDGPVPATAARCPRTMELLDTVPGLTFAEFSLMEPGGAIPTHRAPNKGSLRYLLALKVPEEPGSCALRVADEVVEWSPGKSILFDHAIDHEAWNHGSSDRVMLFLELYQPLHGPLAVFNHFAQWLYGRYPGLRGAQTRIDELDRALNG